MDYLKALAKKGEVIILERKGKATVALKPFSGAGIVTLAKGPKDQLIKELFLICRNYPDKEE